MKQVPIKILSLLFMFLCFGTMYLTKADPLTLTVTKWDMQGYYDEGTPSVKPFSFEVVNASGNKIQLDFYSLLSSAGPGALGITNYFGPPGFDSKAFLESLVPGSTTNLVGSLSFSPMAASFIGNLAPLTYSASQGAATLSGVLSFFHNGQLVYVVSINMSGTGSTERRRGGEYVTTAGGTTGAITIAPVAAEIPEPATLFLLGSGLVAIGAGARRRKKK